MKQKNKNRNRKKIIIFIAMLIFISIGAIRGETDKTKDSSMHSLYGIREEATVTASADTLVLNPGSTIYDLCNSELISYRTYPNMYYPVQVYSFDLSERSSLTINLRPSTILYPIQVKLYKQGSYDTPLLSFSYTTGSQTWSTNASILAEGRYMICFDTQAPSDARVLNTVEFKLQATSAAPLVLNPGSVVHDLLTTSIPAFSTHLQTNNLSQVYYFDLSRKSNLTVGLRAASVAIDTCVRLYKEGDPDNPFLFLTYTPTTSNTIVPYTYEMEEGRYLLHFEIKGFSQSNAYTAIQASLTAEIPQEIIEFPSENCEGNGNLKFTYDTRGNRIKRQ